MKIFKIIMTTLSILLSFLSSSCASNKDGEHGHGVQLSTPPGLPRKLKVNEEAIMVKGSEKKDVMVVETPKKQNEGLSGKSYRQEAKNRHGNKGSSSSSGKGLDEGDDFEFFTMDYRRVRRRRPVHNKSVPTSSTTP
ncbi:hypothetical protein LIER_42919 [Lithospermum erythrorhizon]|uniref:Uncharacterized protein n=1 Tax=Lithospermum erythrorhizon TaxID=34254 RepID=A0AAV3P5D4_LITER